MAGLHGAFVWSVLHGVFAWERVARVEVYQGCTARPTGPPSTPHLRLPALLHQARQEDLGLGLAQVVARRRQLVKQRLPVPRGRW
jgi:hypothetical protein